MNMEDKGLVSKKVLNKIKPRQEQVYPIQFIKNLIKGCEGRIELLKKEINMMVNLKLNYKKVLRRLNA